MHWKLQRNRRHRRLEITLGGHLTAGDSLPAARALADELAQDDAPCELVYDFCGVTGYDPEVREVWQEKLWAVRRRVKRLVFRGKGRWPRLDALYLSVYLKLPRRFVEV
jgi:hypothetical protein